jgi:hypothetical protein
MNDVVLDETGDIDWGDDTYDQVSSIETKENDDEAFKGYIIVEDSGVYVPSDGIAKGNDAFTLIKFIETRNLILQELIRVSKKKTQE